MTTTETLVVSEVFGPTVQGEGPSMGRRAAFVRLGGCNLSCSWCDTPYTWDAKRYDLRAELNRRPVGDILTALADMTVDLTVISGGEPLLHQAQTGWRRLLEGIPGEVEVETNGTQLPTDLSVDRITRFNVSPKLTHAGDPEGLRIQPDALRRFSSLAGQRRAAFKFVITAESDLTEVSALAAEYDFPPGSVWVMTEGTTPEQVSQGTRQIADPAIALGFNVTTRLHTLIWGQERGR